jgi:trans-aconitate 2-methyltransferase
MPAWDAAQYLQFANERTQPSIDLAARIAVDNPARIVDLGCGPGNSTSVLRTRWPGARVMGLDGSPEMIDAAKHAQPGEDWLLADIATWSAELPFDIVFSNATLQWLPDHAALFPRLLAQVARGGALAVQMPAHYHSPVHEAILEAADDKRWRHLMDGPRTALTKESPSFYYNVLRPFCSTLEIWETEYFHVLDGPRAIVEWFRGTGLRPYFEALPSKELRLEFEEVLASAYAQRYPREADGRVLFPFLRLFLNAYRPEG